MGLYIFSFAVIHQNGQKGILQKPIAAEDYVMATYIFEDYISSSEFRSANFEFCEEYDPTFLHVNPDRYAEWGPYIKKDPLIPVGVNSTRPPLRPVD